MTSQASQKTHAQVKAEKRAAALKENLRKRKAFIKDGAQERGREKKNVDSKDSE